jgi:two-component system, NarL family, nitrate/nitrite response regulator NarL
MKCHISIIDDNPDVLQVLQQVLGSSEPSWAVSTFDDPVEGTQAAIDCPPDVIILDLKMPVMDGYDVLTALRKNKVPTRVIILSGESSIATVVKMVKAGACDYVTKPAGDELVVVVKRALIMEGTLESNLLPDSGSQARTEAAALLSQHRMLVDLHKLIDVHFDEEELRELCFDIGADFESLPATGKLGKARELVQYCYRHGSITALTATCSQSRPAIREFSDLLKNSSAS